MEKHFPSVMNGDSYRIIFESIDEGVCVIEQVDTNQEGRIDFRYVITNPAFDQLTGLRDVIGKTMLTLLPDVNQSTMQKYDQIVQTGMPVRFETYEKSLGRWYSEYAFPIDEPELKRVAVIFSDISKIKESEIAFQENASHKEYMLKLSDVLRPLSDPNEIHEAVTRTALNFFGADRCYYCEIEEGKAIIRSDASTGGLPSVAGVYPLSSFPIHKALMDAGRALIVSDVYSSDQVDEELRQICIQLKVISYLDIPVIKNGNLVGILCITQCNPRSWTESEVELAQEISERAWAAVDRAADLHALNEHQEQLLRFEKEKSETLEEAIKMKDEFLYLISHEFKTPIAVISSAMQSIDSFIKPEVPEKLGRYLNMIKMNTNRQLRLVNNLLDITRMNSGQIKFNMHPFDIVYVTGAIVKSVDLYAAQKGIRLIFTSKVAKKLIYLDEEKYERIMLNLLSNALKFSPRDKMIHVAVSMRKRKNQNYVGISVTDEGIGIPVDRQQIVFDRFGQADTSMSRQAEGTGLGLYLVKLMIESLGGEIQLKSQEECGSTFTVLLPDRRCSDRAGTDASLENNNKIPDLNSRIIQAASIEFSDIYFD